MSTTEKNLADDDQVGVGARSSSQSIDREPAVVVRTPDGDPAGVAVYLTADDLRCMGIIPEGVKAVVPRVRAKSILIKPVR